MIGKNSQKGFTPVVVLLSVLLLGLVLGGAFYVSKLSKMQAIDTTNWKTYKDTKYGFAVKYPNTWTHELYTNGYNDMGPYVLVFTTKRTQLEQFPFISVKENWSAEKEIASINTIDPPHTQVVTSSDIKLGNLSAKKLTYTTTIGADREMIIVTRGTATFLFESGPGDTEFSQVISSFK